MTAPILTPALVALRHGFDVASPGRDRTTDGWIGNAAHQLEVSGHNPDDTPGVRAEYSDSDSIPEVRAIDVDVDLRASFTMQDVINRILLTPNDLRRLRYIIFNRTIWSRNGGWVGNTYSGTDPHTNHAHFSGDPLTDNDSSPWSVEQFGDTMPLSDVVRGTDQPDRTVEECLSDGENIRNWGVAPESAKLGPGAPPDNSRYGLLHSRVKTIDSNVSALMETVNALRDEVATLKAANNATPEQIATATADLIKNRLAE